jgi:SAM-dependent methyltransferase
LATPDDRSVSQFVASSLARMNLPAAAVVLDLAAGAGRHSRLFRTFGHSVVALDIDLSRLSVAQKVASGLWSVVADASRELPVRDAAFDAAAVVHFISGGLFERVAAALKPGGWFVFESFGGHGGNWRVLPAAGQYRSELDAMFDVVDYRERPVGPTRTEAVSVRFLARRR